MDQENEGNKVIIIWLSFCKKQTDKQTKQTKEIGICPKVFFAGVNTHKFRAKERLFAVYSLASSVMQTWIFSTLEM